MSAKNIGAERMMTNNVRWVQNSGGTVGCEVVPFLASKAVLGF